MPPLLSKEKRKAGSIAQRVLLSIVGCDSKRKRKERKESGEIILGNEQVQRKTTKRSNTDYVREVVADFWLDV